MGLDRRTINMIKFLTKTLLGIGGGLYALIRVSGETDVLRITGALVLLAGIAYFARAAYTLFIQKGKEPLSYGKWAVVTGSTSGIGKGFVEALAAKGLSKHCDHSRHEALKFASIGVNLLLISRDEQKLIAQAKELSAAHKVECQYLVNDFKDIDNSRAFYHRLAEVNSTKDNNTKQSKTHHTCMTTPHRSLKPSKEAWACSLTTSESRTKILNGSTRHRTSSPQI